MNGPFFDALREQVSALGGYHNAHTHLDRAYTLGDGYVDHGRLAVLENSHISLQQKHKLIATVHEGPAYDPQDLQRRVRQALDEMIAVGTRRVDTMVDVAPGRVNLTALETLGAIRDEYRDRIEVQLAAYTPFGFRDDMPAQWDVFEAGARQSDFIGCLPEADDIDDYPGHIGFDEHCRRMHALARDTGKMLHVHTDQLNIPSEHGTERLIEVVLDQGVLNPGGVPQIWAVHAISPSTYRDAAWDRYVEGLRAANIGIISCPSAALGMRQLRAVQTPTYNAIVRVLELAVAGVPVRLGSDNIADMCSPSTTADLTHEVFALSAAVRYYQPEILAAFASGKGLSTDQRETLKEHLVQNEMAAQKLVQRWVK